MAFDWARVSKPFIPFRKLGENEQKLRRSRSELRVQNNLGIIAVDGKSSGQVYRDKNLEILDSYYENRQYASLPPWEDKKNAKGQDTPRRSRQPKIKYAFARNLASRVGAKIVGETVFPHFKIEDSPDDQEFIAAVLKTSRLRAYLVEPIRRAINTGSVFVRFNLVAGKYQIKWYHSKFCYPTFQENDELESVVIKYVYEDPSEKDQNGRPLKRWFKMELGTESEILFDNPVYDPEAEEEPEFQVVDQVDHGLGFVQGEWITTSENQDEDDGYGLIQDIMEFIDELNYSISASSRSIDYNQDPQLIFKKVDEDFISELVRSVTKSWNLGRDGEAEFLESDLSGVQMATELRDKVVNHISDISRAVILNPEKMVAAAQSARAMEVLNEPLLDLINELRTSLEVHIQNLVLKIAFATLLLKLQGIDIPIDIPDGYSPKSFDLTLKWPKVFRETLEDQQKAIAIANTAASGNIISRKTATRYVAEVFGIEDVDAEHAEIAAQPVFNPFGTF